jgi:hypothetical protein
VAFGAALLLGLTVSAGTARAQSVLERVLAHIEVSGLFTNAAQSGFGPRPVRIDAGITTIMEGLPPASLSPETISGAPAYLILGSLESVALGATNAGDVILSVSVEAARPSVPDDPPPEGGLRGVPAASIMQLGDNMTLQGSFDVLLLEDAIVASYSAAADIWQVGTAPETPVALLNLAANGGDVNARILTRVNAAVLDARDMTATALGAVNVGLASIIGDN